MAVISLRCQAFHLLELMAGLLPPRPNGSTFGGEGEGASGDGADGEHERTPPGGEDEAEAEASSTSASQLIGGSMRRLAIVGRSCLAFPACRFSSRTFANFASPISGFAASAEWAKK